MVEASKVGPSISVIIPTLNEAENIVRLLKKLTSLENIEVVVVDGGSGDNTLDAARQYCRHVLQTAPGRGHQLNVGAAEASGDIFIFLHADCQVEGRLFEIIRSWISKGYIGGCCRLKFNDDNRLLKLIAWGSNLRAVYLKSFYGDQGIFVTREVFQKSGGFKDIPLMEDVEFSRRLRKCGPVTVIGHPITTSARRFKKQGILKTIIRMQLLKTFFLLGFSPQFLNKLYK